jgi:hypothetical protein
MNKGCNYCKHTRTEKYTWENRTVEFSRYSSKSWYDYHQCNAYRLYCTNEQCTNHDKKVYDSRWEGSIYDCNLFESEVITNDTKRSY